MKDITISGKRIQTEIKIMMACFVVSIILNAIAIMIYDTGWIEIFTQFHVEIIITAAMYLASVVIRLIYKGAIKLVKGK